MKKLLILLLIFLFIFPLSAGAQAFDCPLCNEVHRDLQLTSPAIRGDDVLYLQLRLKELGFNPGPLDGIYGPATQSAIKEFHLSNELPFEGVVTLEAWNLLASDQVLVEAADIELLEKPDGQISIVIHADKKILTVYSDHQVFVEFPVAVGKYKTPTPIGEWRVVHKSTNWGGGFGSRWLGLNVPWGIYGIHGTNKPYSIGSNASHGCIRMHNKNVEKLYPIIPMGTPVSIISDTYPAYPPGFKKRPLKLGMSGPDVVEMQLHLKELGLFWGRADGRFGTSTETFVKRYQAWTGQEITGEFSVEDYAELKALIDLIKNPTPQ